MKKHCLLLFLIIFILTLTGCSGQNTATDNAKQSTVAQQSEAKASSTTQAAQAQASTAKEQGNTKLGTTTQASKNAKTSSAKAPADTATMQDKTNLNSTEQASENTTAGGTVANSSTTIAQNKAQSGNNAQTSAETKTAGTAAPTNTTQEGQTVHELKICSSLGQKTTELLLNDFLQRSSGNIKPSVSYIPGGTMEERFKFIDAGAFDCWLGGTAEEYFSANEKGLLQSYAAKESFKVPAELRNRHNHWTTLYLSHIAILSNKHKLHSFGLYAPTTWDELLAPQLKEEIALPDPALGGASFGMLTSIWQLRGKETALKYAAAFNKQQPVLTNSVMEAVDMVYQGKKTIAVLPVAYALELEEKHSHLFATVPKDANRNLLTGIALLKSCKNEAASQDFIDYLMSDFSEKALHASGQLYTWHVKHYPHNNNRNKLVGNLRVPVDDLAWTSTYKSEIIRQWLEAK